MKYLSLDKNSEQKVAYQHEIKQSNLKQAFDLIRSGACTSRSELAREMGLSATAVSSLTDELMQHGLVLESGVIHADTPGRRPISLKINESAKQIAVFSLDSAYMHFTLYNIGLNAIEEISLPYAGLISRGENRGEEYAAMFEDIILNKSRKIVREKLIAVCIGNNSAHYADHKACSHNNGAKNKHHFCSSAHSRLHSSLARSIRPGS